MTKQAAAKVKANLIAELGEDGYSRLMAERAANRSHESYLSGGKKGAETKRLRRKGKRG